MKKIGLYALLGLFFCSCGKEVQQATRLSPDGHLQVEVGMDSGRIYYTVSRDSVPVITRSYLGLQLADGDLQHGFSILNVSESAFSETWEQPWGEELTADNTYNQLTLELQQNSEQKRRLNVVFRVFNDGIGFRYEFPEQPNLKKFVITDECTQFTLASDGKAWAIPANVKYYEALYQPVQVKSLQDACTPLTVEMNDSLYITIHEANLTDYAAMNLKTEGESTTLQTDLTPWSTGEKVFAQTPSVSPWRTVIIGHTPGDLLLSRLMLNLNEPCAIDTSWIEPGRYIGIWWAIHQEKYTWKQGPKHGATTANAKRYIDFAAAHGFSGVLTEGWNVGWDGNWSQDNLFNFTQAYPDFDLEEVTRYAASKGVRWIAHNETGGFTKNYEEQLDSAFALYHRLGVNAVKTGYVNEFLDNQELHGSQYGVRHYRKVIETAAKYHLMIDNHEPVMPTGLQRTYPNLMTQEGVRGQEYDAWSPDGGNPPEHTTILPFTRGLAGPIDFTPGTFNFNNPVLPTTHPQTTLAKQLALGVILYSPLQMASDLIENYEGQPALAFISACPTTWAKTVVSAARIGEYVTLARKERGGEDWFIGSITNADPRTMLIPLNFLDAGSSYEAIIYRDGPGADYRTDPYPLTIEKRKVDAGTTLELELAPGGGAAIQIRKL